ncbi:hypothetical protein QTV44_002613 [Vibrio vulnificus]|nr:hypothetical protein [Vibrio vulnificus]
MVKSRQVIMVESHVVASTLRRQIYTLNPLLDVDIIATGGHLFDYNYRNGKLYLDSINTKGRNQVAGYNGWNIAIATDPDPQGELIANHIKTLTPDSVHRRAVFNDLTLSGIAQSIERFNRQELTFSRHDAAMAAMLKVINLAMQQKRHRRQYLTTTGIDIAKQFRDYGRLNHMHMIKISDTISTSVSKTHGSIEIIRKPNPATTKSIIMQQALDTRNIDTMNELRSGFDMMRLSYIRTTETHLPISAKDAIRDYAARHYPVNIESHFVPHRNASHYALHNTDFAITDVEHLIAQQNASACSSQCNTCYEIITSNGWTTYANENDAKIKGRIAPEKELAMLLANSSDSAPSTITQSARKYAKHFYNGEWLNQPLIDQTLDIAQQHYPKILAIGVRESLKEVLASEPSTIELVMDNKPITHMLDAKRKSQELKPQLLDSMDMVM